MIWKGRSESFIWKTRCLYIENPNRSKVKLLETMSLTKLQDTQSIHKNHPYSIYNSKQLKTDI